MSKSQGEWFGVPIKAQNVDFTTLKLPSISSTIVRNIGDITSTNSNIWQATEPCYITGVSQTQDVNGTAIITVNGAKASGQGFSAASNLSIGTGWLIPLPFKILVAKGDTIGSIMAGANSKLREVKAYKIEWK